MGNKLAWRNDSMSYADKIVPSIVNSPIALKAATDYNRGNSPNDSQMYRSINPTLVVVGQVIVMFSFQ